MLAFALACGGDIGQSGGPDGDSPASDPGSNDVGDGDATGDGAGDGDGDGTIDSSDDPDAPYVASDSVARRLTRAELDNALRDLLGDTARAATTLLPEDPFSPYDNDYTGQAASGALIDSFSSLADDVAARIVSDPDLLSGMMPCTPSGPGDSACFRQLVEQLTQRAFRRPMETSELDVYMALLDFATEDNPDVDNDFDTAVELLLRAVIMDPEFLYRVEAGEPTDDDRIFQLNDYEIATRMSFLLWGTIPDDALWADAEAGRLTDAEGRRSVLTRMREDPRALEQLRRFHAMWLGYRVIPHSPELTAAFNRETGALIDRSVSEGSYLDLFTSDETFIDDTLAAHYDLPAPGTETWVSYGDSGRAGLLSHGSFLSAFGKFTDTSPTQRGILIRTRLLCQEIPPPPPDVMADQPPGDDDALCKYDRYEQHRSSPSCNGCHGQMDPIGFGLENYDLAGRFREHDDGLPDCTIEGQGEVPPYGSFSGPAELAQLLIDSGELERCVTSQFFSFAVGRELKANEEQAVDALTEDFVGAGTAFGELLEAYVSSEAFGLRKEPEL